MKYKVRAVTRKMFERGSADSQQAVRPILGHYGYF